MSIFHFSVEYLKLEGIDIQDYLICRYVYSSGTLSFVSHLYASFFPIYFYILLFLISIRIFY